MRKIVGMKLHDLPAGWTVGSFTVTKPEYEQNRLYENWQNWLEGITKNA